MAQRLSRMDLGTFQISVRILQFFLLIPTPSVKSFTSPTVFFAKPPVACVLPRHLSRQHLDVQHTHNRTKDEQAKDRWGSSRENRVCGWWRWWCAKSSCWLGGERHPTREEQTPAQTHTLVPPTPQKAIVHKTPSPHHDTSFVSFKSLVCY